MPRRVIEQQHTVTFKFVWVWVVACFRWLVCTCRHGLWGVRRACRQANEIELTVAHGSLGGSAARCFLVRRRSGCDVRPRRPGELTSGIYRRRSPISYTTLRRRVKQGDFNTDGVYQRCLVVSCRAGVRSSGEQPLQVLGWTGTGHQRTVGPEAFERELCRGFAQLGHHTQGPVLLPRLCQCTQ